MTYIDQTNLIHMLVRKKNMTPYAITMTFRYSPAEKESLNDSMFYNQQKIHWEIKSSKLLERHKERIEMQFRLTLNKVASIIAESSNITRNKFIKQIPITFYEFQISNKDTREKAIVHTKNTIHISPLHIHGTIIVPSFSEDKFSIFIGRDTIHKYCKSGQSSEVKAIHHLDEWLNYVRRDYYAPIASDSMHPAKFSINPYGYMDSL